MQTERDRATITECNGLLESKHCSRDSISTDRSSSCVSLFRAFHLSDPRRCALCAERRKTRLPCHSWHTSFKLSFRDLVSMMADRGITLKHTTILRWVQHYLPEFENRWSRYARPVGGSWRMDETYTKVRGRWVYLYRALDKAGWTVDFFLSRNRDVTAAKTFLRNAMKNQRTPTKITRDALCGVASRSAGDEGDRGTSTSSKSAIEPISSNRTTAESNNGSVRCWDSNDSTTRQSAISGNELAEHIKKGQFKTGKFGNRNATMSEL